MKFPIASVCVALAAVSLQPVNGAKSKDHQKVTCGSAIKLTHVPTDYKLHSHDIKYGSGSGQQSVTAFPNVDDPNSYFVVQSAFGKEECQRGEPIKCNARIRLLHMNTDKYLHSHLHQSPLSSNQEVSAFEERNGGDDWIVQCVQSGAYWMRDSDVRLAHGETGKYLFSSKQFMFQNPVRGQLEVAAVSDASKGAVWQAKEGIYFSDNPIMS